LTLAQRRDKAAKAFAKFEVFIVSANEEQRLYFTRDLPALCRSFEMLGTYSLSFLSHTAHYSTTAHGQRM
jgi:CMP-2-keto-3-deoxyoctulosonic acid synthetase